MYRTHLETLKKWISKKNRKPLIIRGARQVGKSTLVREFARIQKLNLIEVNLEKHLELTSVFESNKPDRVIESIADLLKIPIFGNEKSNVLLFIDEIQSIPAAISCLRYFYEDYPKLPVVTAGSLLEFVLNDLEYSMPVGRVEFLYLGPMSFREFLLARKENYLLQRLDSMKNLDEITDVFHQKCLEQLKAYLFVGGMPEAVKVSCEEGIEYVSPILEQIIETYQSDFVKYTKKTHLIKIQKVFRYLYLNPCKKIKYSKIAPEETTRDLKFNLDLLFKAKIASPVYHSRCSGIPLEATVDESIFKILLLDVGLMNHLQKTSWLSIKNFSEEELLTDGQIAEQFIGQELLTLIPSYQNPSLNYWLREGKSSNAEVDYIIERSPYLIAIEVKAGSAGKIRSLHQWMRDIVYKKKIALRFNLSNGSREMVTYKFEDGTVKYKLLSLPLYLVSFFERHLD